MGLYDTINIDFNISTWIPNFPIPDEELKTLDYQTKDLNSFLEHYVIDEYFTLKFGSISAKELAPYSTTYDLSDGSVLTLPYTGEILFYTSSKYYTWIEFLGVFINSHLTSLHCIKAQKRDPSS